MTGALQSGKRLGTDYWLGQRAVFLQTAWLARLGYVSPQDWPGSPCQAAGCQMVMISCTQSRVEGSGSSHSVRFNSGWRMCGYRVSRKSAGIFPSPHGLASEGTEAEIAVRCIMVIILFPKLLSHMQRRSRQSESSKASLQGSDPF